MKANKKLHLFSDHTDHRYLFKAHKFITSRIKWIHKAATTCAPDGTTAFTRIETKDGHSPPFSPHFPFSSTFEAHVLT